jgi:glycosyltransferase involved in cell wall biosynthesis
MITVITPNYNYGNYIEATLVSILDQQYPNLQLIVIDGGSTDRSIDIIKKYEKYIDYWHSRSDSGQADAINQGLALAQGQLVNWINSDDQLRPGSLFHIAECYRKEPNKLFAGSVLNISTDDDQSSEIVTQYNLKVSSIVNGDATFHQPGIWWSTAKLKQLGGLDTSLHFCFDYLLLLRYLSRWQEVYYSNQIIANFTLHPLSKTSTSQIEFDLERYNALISTKHDGCLDPFRQIIQRRVRTLYWHKTVSEILLSQSYSRILRAAQVLALSSLDPQIRFNRFTAGVIKKSLMGEKVS